MGALPPSPVWSDCDSMYGIEDLDAYLDAQGELSHWPTPPLFDALKDETVVREVEVELSDDESAIDCRDNLKPKRDQVLTDAAYRIAELFTAHATIGVEFNEIDVRMIEKILIQAQLPLEVLALAFNILAGLNCHSLPLGSFESAPNDLVTVTALSLAVSYTNDCPPTARYWSRHVCDGAWTPSRIDRTTLQVYAELGWRLHNYSATETIRRAVDELTRPRSFSTLAIRPHRSTKHTSHAASPMPTHLKLLVQGTGTMWENGQITPEESPSENGSEDPFNCFLRLL